jgi:hypothetical protein
MDLANEGLLAALQIDGMFIRRRSKIQSKPVASYAERLKAKFKPPVPTVSVQSNCPSQTRNAWNTPTLKKGQDNIPEIPTLSCHHTQKKQHTESGSNDTAEDDTSLSPPSLGTTQTELTDERTEMQAAITSMRSSFTAEINKIKNQSDKIQKELVDRIATTEKDFQEAKDVLLNEFRHTEEKQEQYLKAMNAFGDKFHKGMINAEKRYIEMEKRQAMTDQRLCSMMEILLTIHQSLATGEKPATLTQEQIGRLVSPRDGAPDGSNTDERSSTNLQGGGRQL